MTSFKIYSKIFEDNIYLINKDSPFNKDSNFIKWKRDNKISAVIIRPDRHVYGCCDNESMIIKVDELNKKLINNFRIISNPGCYPTSRQLPLIPLIKSNLINTKNIIIDSKKNTELL